MVLELLQKKLCYSDQSGAKYTVEMKKAEAHRSRKRINEEWNSSSIKMY